MMFIIKSNTTCLKKWAFIFFIGFTLSACGYSDPFYGEGSGGDFVRFPLIKPYYAMSLTDTPGWFIPLENELPLSKTPFFLQIDDVRKIAVAGTTIMVYTPDNTKHGYTAEDEKIFHWFVLIPDQHLEIGFETETEFLSYLQQNKLDKPKWLEPLAILQKYNETWCLDWIPDCK